MWSFAVLCATVACFISIYDIFTDYYKYNTINQSRVILKDDLKFPQVVFCRKLKNLSDFNQTVRKSLYFQRPIKMKTIDVFDYDGHKYECLSFDRSYETSYINLKYKDRSGGFYIEFNEFNDYVMYVYILTKRAKPIFSYPELVVKKFTKNIIYFNKIKSEHLGEPYSECVRDFKYLGKTSDLVNRTIKFNSFYQNSKCRFLCKFKYYVEKYNCSYPGLYETASSSVCREVDIYRTNDTKIGECYKNCPIECKSKAYLLDHLLVGCDPNLTQIRLSYRYDQETLITESPKTNICDLISKLGGTLGLFIGFKFLSFIDILEFSFELGYLVFNKTRRYLL